MAGQIFHEWNGTVLTITSDSGTSSCDLKGATGDTGIRGPQGIQGEKGEKGAGEKGDTGAAFTYDMFTPEQLAALTGPEGPTGKTGETGAPFTYDMFTEAQLESLRGPQGIQGKQGIQGEIGPAGKDGVGIPTGGTTGQILTKASAADYDTKWADAASGYAYNLLDNSDFRNPVNQRGQTDYTSNGYTIDRWELYSGAVGVSSLGYITTSGQMYQKIAIPTDKVYTFAIENDAGIALVTGIPANGIHSATLGNALIKLATIGEYVEVVIEPSEGHNLAGAYWAALYEGSYTADTLPPYVPKGYAAELAECMRYYQKFQMLTGTSVNAAQRVFVVLPVAMRIMPTIAYELMSGAQPNNVVAQAQNIIDVTGAASYSHLSISLSADL